MNEILRNIKTRRSRRGFSTKGIDDDVISEIIEAGRYAPTALNKQPWKFIVITNKTVIKKLSSIVKDKTLKIAKFLPLLKIFKAVLRDPQVVGAIKKTISDKGDTVFYDAPLLIFIAADKKGGPYIAKDCALASQNMMLYAHSLGISSCFIGRADFIQMSAAAKKIIGLPSQHVIEAAIVFGYAPQTQAKMTLPPERRRDNIINWVRE